MKPSGSLVDRAHDLGREAQRLDRVHGLRDEADPLTLVVADSEQQPGRTRGRRTNKVR